MEHLEPIEKSKEFVSTVYNMSLDAVQMALALTVALAWYSFVKGGIREIWKSRSDSVWASGVFAIIVTIIFAVVIYIIKNVLGSSVSTRPVMYAVAPAAM